VRLAVKYEKNINLLNIVYFSASGSGERRESLVSSASHWLIVATLYAVNIEHG
jgi:hypothetical protein